MINSDKIDSIAQHLNEKVNLPFIGEKGEHKILKEFVRKAGKSLEGEISPELFNYINNADEGIGKEQIGEIKAQILNVLKNKIDIPIIKGKLEDSLLASFSEKIADAMQKGKSV